MSTKMRNTVVALLVLLAVPFLPMPRSGPAFGVTITQAGVAELTWSGDAQFVDSIQIRRNRDGGAFNTLATLPATDTSYTDTAGPLAAGSTYCWRLVLINSDGQSHLEGCATVLAPQPPVPPSSFSVTLISGGGPVADFTSRRGVVTAL